MIRKILICLFFSASAYALPPVIAPSTPVVNQGGTVQFQTVDQGSWTCVGTTSTGGVTGCQGSINMSNGLYVAPSSVTAMHMYGGMQILPNNAVYYVKIDSLPVHTNNATYLTDARFYGGTPTFSVDFPYNYVDNSSVTDDMSFHYTPANNGTYRVPSFPNARAEHGWFAALRGDDGEDHHVIMIDRDRWMLSEFYQYYPNCKASAASVTGNVATITCTKNPIDGGFFVGSVVTVGGFTGGDTFFNVASVTVGTVTATSISFPLTHANATATSFGSATKYTADTSGTFNSASGIEYDPNSYELPKNNATDAAGMKLQWGILNLQELRRAEALGGDINHAYRVTFPLAVESSTLVWPATTVALDPGSLPFGIRLRLKSNFDISGYSALAQIILRSFKQYGFFNIDGGIGWNLNAEITRWPKKYLSLIHI